MKTLKEQIEGKCVHFTGLMDKLCRAGVAYDSFGKVKINVIPCLRGGTATCDKMEFPSPESVSERLEAIESGSNKAIKLMLAVKAHSETTGFKCGMMTCPNCGNNQTPFSIAHNSHVRVSCKTCQINLME